MKSKVLCIYWTENPDLRHSRAPADNRVTPMSLVRILIRISALLPTLTLGWRARRGNAHARAVVESALA
jgi:hypothetical protein